MPVCEICSREDFRLVATVIREGEGRIFQCRSCGLLIQNLDWTTSDIQQYYEVEYQETNSLVAGRIQTPHEHFTDRLQTIGPIYRNIAPLLNPRDSVLEVGCGAAALLFRIMETAPDGTGIELYPPFVDYIRNELGIPVYNRDINELDLPETFDLIVSIATLDHLPNPLQTLLTMKRLLRAGGKIYIEVPNYEEALNHFIPAENREKFNRFFWHRAHFFYFTRDTIRALFQKAGFRVDISCRHDYTLKNFLTWYFTGSPQASYIEGTRDTRFFSGDHPFETRMNRMFEAMEKEFKDIMAETFTGDNLCCTAWVETGDAPGKGKR